ncbi:MAG: hypothetical protein QXL32_04120 [Candidatus Bathyarchaeia archaeon]
MAVLVLIIVFVIADRLKYEQIRKAYRYYERDGIEGEFIEYVFLDPTTIEPDSINGEVIHIKREELRWGAIATLSYAISMIICGAVMLLLFYEIIHAPPWVGFIFLFLIMLLAYLMNRSWRRGVK